MRTSLRFAISASKSATRASAEAPLGWSPIQGQRRRGGTLRETRAGALPAVPSVRPTVPGSLVCEDAMKTAHRGDPQHPFALQSSRVSCSLASDSHELGHMQERRRALSTVPTPQNPPGSSWHHQECSSHREPGCEGHTLGIRPTELDIEVPVGASWTVCRGLNGRCPRVPGG